MATVPIEDLIRADDEQFIAVNDHDTLQRIASPLMSPTLSPASSPDPILRHLSSATPNAAVASPIAIASFSSSSTPSSPSTSSDHLPSYDAARAKLTSSVVPITDGPHWSYRDFDFILHYDRLAQFLKEAGDSSSIRSLQVIGRKELLHKTRLVMDQYAPSLIESVLKKSTWKSNTQTGSSSLTNPNPYPQVDIVSIHLRINSLINLVLTDCQSQLVDVDFQLGLNGIAIAEGLQKNTTLRRLSLAKNIIAGPGMKSICSALHNHPTLEILDLSQNILYPECVPSLISLLRTNRRIHSIDLSVNKIGGEGLIQLANLLGANYRNESAQQTTTEAGVSSSLYSGLSSIASSIASITGLVPAPITINSSLTSLDLSNNKIGPNCEILAPLLASPHCSLRSLFLTLNDIGDTGARFVAHGLKSNVSLTHLALNDNNISASGCRSLMQALERNASLKKLELNWNSCGRSGLGEGAKAIGKALQRNQCLETLLLIDNGFTDTAIGFLFDGLLERTDVSPLIHLELSVNPLECGGMPSLAKFLASPLCDLHVLTIGRCGIKNEGAMTLAPAVKENRTLKRMDLSENSFNNQGGLSLLNSCEHHPTMVDVEMRCTNHSGLTPLSRAYRKARINQLGRVLSNQTPMPMVLARIVAAYQFGDWKAEEEH